MVERTAYTNKRKKLVIDPTDEHSKQHADKITKLRLQGNTWEVVAMRTGYNSPTSPRVWLRDYTKRLQELNQ